MKQKKTNLNKNRRIVTPAEPGSAAKVLQTILLAILIFAVFAGTFRNGFVWDDDDYIHNNPLLTEKGGLQKIWTSYYAAHFDPQNTTPQYYPLVFTTFYIEHMLWGFDPAGYHVTNVLLHIADSILLLLVLRKMGISWYISLITAALFGIHPTQVESVAWATERKNVMVGLFYFGAFLSFLHYQDTSKIKFYVTSLILFVFTLLSKTTAVTLPVALILAGYFMNRPLRKTIIPAIPFFALSTAAGLVTTLVEHGLVGAKGEMWNFPFAERFLIASKSLCFYIGKLLWPHPLSFIYPRWEINTHSVTAYLPLIAVVAATVAVFIFRKKLGKITVFALLYFIISILPALGFISFYMMRYSFVADHFLYLGSWSIMLLMVTGAAYLIDRLQQKRDAAIAITAIVLTACAALTISQSKNYKDLQTLWERTIETNPNAWLAHNNLGVIYSSQKQFDKAIEHYSITLKLNPTYHLAYNNLGVAYNLTGKTEKAIEYYKKALELNPNYTEALYNIAAAYFKLDKNNEAIEYFKKVVHNQPDYMVAWYNLAICCSKSNRLPEAAEAYKKVTELNPKHAEAFYNLGVTYDLSEKFDDAIASYKKAFEIKPDYIEAKYRLALVYRKQGKLRDAVKLLHSIIDAEPDEPQVNYDLGVTYYMLKEYENAKLYFRIAENQGIPTPPDIRQALYR